MPEYLAPGVYVEEIPSGIKPIQAAGTSTAGMVGMAARGPINTPTLVTSLGDYNRKFGGALDPTAFAGGKDALPYAAEGFFINGGARLYVVRVVGTGAKEATLAVASHDPNDTAATPVTALTAHARYPGDWGNDLRLTASAVSLVETELAAAAVAADTQVKVGTTVGLYVGSVVAITKNPTTTVVREVTGVDAQSNTLTLASAVGTALAKGDSVDSQEFNLTVERMENGKAVESETFDRLSLAATHPRFAPKIIGKWENSEPSLSGASELIRIAPTGLDPAVQPFFGVIQTFSGGDDKATAVTPADYEGNPSNDPGERTGIWALENEPAINIVAVPGQTDTGVQKALIAHCEKMRYRFAVLDTPLGAKIDAAKKHRQNFDSTRAAIYYPAMEIADRFGDPGERRVIAPSGHVLGIYARTDITRGVHKAPANEVVRGILSFDTKLTKGEQDILNPININCFRDFRTEYRGLRVYGARVATSDPEWRYINVRRLLLFIEQSLDTGLQWAVFEPNAEPLWATLKQSVSGFLTTVWSNGALEGTKSEEAFFVNVGYGVTMTQDDVDNGRAIIEVGVAPVKPAEYVILRISQKTREATS